jgi:hypothetical protein
MSFFPHSVANLFAFNVNAWKKRLPFLTYWLLNCAELDSNPGINAMRASLGKLTISTAN